MQPTLRAVYDPTCGIMSRLFAVGNPFCKRLWQLNNCAVARGDLLLADQRTTSISPKHVPMSGLSGFVNSSGRLYGEMAKAGQLMLHDVGVGITQSELQDHTDTLAMSYLLSTGLICLRTNVKDKEGAEATDLFITKNLQIASLLGTPDSRLPKLTEYIAATSLEIAEAKFRCIVFKLGERGYERPSTRQIIMAKRDCVFLPSWVAVSYRAALVNAMHKNLMAITFSNAQGSCTLIHTTLDARRLQQVSSKWDLTGVGYSNGRTPLTSICLVDMRDGSMHDVCIAAITESKVISGQWG